MESEKAEKCIHLKMVHYPAKKSPGLKLVSGHIKCIKSMNHKAWNLPLCEKYQIDCPIYRGLAHSCTQFETTTNNPPDELVKS